MTPSAPPRPAAPLFAVGLLVFGCGGAAAAWIVLALVTGSPCPWMAVVAALDAAWLLRLGGVPRHWMRPLLAVVATAAIALVAHWGIAAAQMAGPMGLGLVESVLRMGPSLAWTLAGLSHQGLADLAWYALALVVAIAVAR